MRLSLYFKNVGRFAEEVSARYEAKVNDNFIVRVSNKMYQKEGFSFEFLTSDGWGLKSITGDFLSTFSNSTGTKKEAMTWVENLVNNKYNFAIIDNEAMATSKMMAENTFQSKTHFKIKTK